LWWKIWVLGFICNSNNEVIKMTDKIKSLIELINQEIESKSIRKLLIESISQYSDEEVDEFMQSFKTKKENQIQ